LSHEEFLDLLDRLRYVGGASTEEREEARRTLGGVVTRMLKLEVPGEDQQVDVVLTAKELAALPLEAASAPDGEPLVLRETPTVEITRRVRGAFRSRAPAWPADPRILFAAAAPAREVPAEAHARALRSALAPWIEALEGVPGSEGNEKDVLTILPRASVGAIRQACEERRSAGGFTHVHLLAHGCAIGSGMRQRYGVELHAELGKGIEQVLPEDLVEALSAGGPLPNVVTLTACDSANVGSTAVSSASVAHALHSAGVPVVLGSQFPLTVVGSNIVVERFYRALLRPGESESGRGTDVRDALHEARVAVHALPETGHDWLSLVMYLQLPEGYDDRLLDVGLETELAALRTAQRWADCLIVRGGGATPEHHDRVVERLRERIASLRRWAERVASTDRRPVLEENRGLLGSAHKRLAEVLSRRSRLGGEPERWLRESREALEQARSWYELGFEENLSAHWHGVQQLSLEAVLRGRISQPWQWRTALGAARTSCKKERECWAAGSLAELHLLAACAGEGRQLDEAVEALRDLERRVELKGRAEGKGDRFPLESTARQLERYASWWTTGNGFFPGAADLAADARQVIERAGCGTWVP
jgi:hypothetical protein